MQITEQHQQQKHERQRANIKPKRENQTIMVRSFGSNNYKKGSHPIWFSAGAAAKSKAVIITTQCQITQ